MKILYAANSGFHAHEAAGYLERSGFRLTRASTGEEALELMETYIYDAAVLVGKFSDMTALDVLRSARRGGRTVPVLIIADRNDPMETTIDALGAGADDVLTAIRPAELVARLTAIVRRAHGHSSSTIQAGRLCIDITGHCASVDDQRLPLTPSEYDLLEALALRKGRMMTRNAMLDVLYAGGDEPGVKIIEVFICKLRKKLVAALGGEDPIETVWGRGYVMRDAVGMPRQAAAA